MQARFDRIDALISEGNTLDKKGAITQIWKHRLEKLSTFLAHYSAFLEPLAFPVMHFLPQGCLCANQVVIIIILFRHFFTLRYNFRFLLRNTNQQHRFSNVLLLRRYVSLTPIFGLQAGCGGDLQNLLHHDRIRLVFVGSYSKLNPGICFKYNCG